MQFGGIQLLTTLDYPENIATTLFVDGCNMRCEFCHNSTMVLGQTTKYDERDILNKLKSRKDKINHIVITGGEPTIYGYDLISFITKLKEEGFFVKLDTNGLHPNVIKSLVTNNLLDYIAMDIKTILDKEEYSKISGVTIDDDKLHSLKNSIYIISSLDIPHEFRTTVSKTFHPKEILIKLAESLYYPYYIQQFVMNDNVFNQGIIGYTDTELREIMNELVSINPNIKSRGI